MPDPYRFLSLGPYDVPVLKEKRAIDFETARDAVFEQAAADAKGYGEIKEAIGCYVFCLSPSGSAVEWPYYVGQAARQTLFARTFQTTDKPALYNEILTYYYVRAKPIIYLLPLLTPQERFARLGSNQTRINNAEKMLIGMAWERNGDLWNIKHRGALEAFTIDGTAPTRGRESKAASRFRTLLGFENIRKPADAAS